MQVEDEQESTRRAHPGTPRFSVACCIGCLHILDGLHGREDLEVTREVYFLVEAPRIHVVLQPGLHVLLEVVLWGPPEDQLQRNGNAVWRTPSKRVRRGAGGRGRDVGRERGIVRFRDWGTREERGGGREGGGAKGEERRKPRRVGRREGEGEEVMTKDGRGRRREGVGGGRGTRKEAEEGGRRKEG